MNAHDLILLHVQAVVQEVQPNRLHLKDGGVLDFGLCIWSTGVGPTSFIESLPFAKTNLGRLAVNGQMQVLIKPGQVLPCAECVFSTNSWM